MTYGEMAAALGVTLCRGRLATGHYCGQEHKGPGSVTDNTVHFRRERVSSVSTYAFLRLVARAKDPSIDQDVPWRRVYRLNMAARQHARIAGVRIPVRTTMADRAFVLASVATVSNDVPMRRQAYDWARRPKHQEENDALV